MTGEQRMEHNRSTADGPPCTFVCGEGLIRGRVMSTRRPVSYGLQTKDTRQFGNTLLSKYYDTLRSTPSTHQPHIRPPVCANNIHPFTHLRPSPPLHPSTSFPLHRHPSPPLHPSIAPPFHRLMDSKVLTRH